MNILELVTLGIEMEIHIPRKRVLDGPTENREEFTYWGRPKSLTTKPKKWKQFHQISYPRLECDSHHFTIREVHVHTSWRQYLDLSGPKENGEVSPAELLLSFCFSCLHRIIDFRGQQGT